MTTIRRIGNSARWSDVVIHRGVAQWVEVAEDPSTDAQGQAEQVLQQINATLEQIGSNREQILQVLVYLHEMADAPALNAAWDAWVPPGHAPIRACVQAGLSGNYRVEMVISAAVEE
ncbi:Putative aminoacrylate peracid reductase RutC [Anatilimnocola aggregata]|uniref:Aminoacrylate peracid reductase RutC n=1 Tax=Anatilimnocola aggregata TaxID=2528021 RepID=A0A517YGG7_9BACT|nr:RidA family protein [Anatilimnocola aggregata]QDU29323.1 Putative aminoacrylate peracid reductase RutC [Anatilimnocola aggregata]